MTPGIQEGGSSQDNVRNIWKKQVESEERLYFFRKMLELDLSVRELEHLGEDLNSKFRSEDMKKKRSEKQVIRHIMRLKEKDEKKFQREIKGRRKEARKQLENEMSKGQFRKTMSKLNEDAKKHRNKFDEKTNHI